MKSGPVLVLVLALSLLWATATGRLDALIRGIVEYGSDGTEDTQPASFPGSAPGIVPGLASVPQYIPTPETNPVRGGLQGSGPQVVPGYGTVMV